MKLRARLQTSASYAQRPGVQRIRLPHRATMANRFGSRVAHLPVYTGPKVDAALRKRGAEAAALDGAVFLRDENPSAELVAHEVVHALQQPLVSGDGEALLSRLERAPEVPAESRAENEAEVLADPGARAGDLAVRHDVAPGTVALRRSGSDVPTVDAPEASPEPASEPVAQSEPVSEEAQSGEPARAESEVSEPAPTFAPAEVPETALDPEAEAAREAERAAAEEALAAADTPTAVMDAYAAMPPSVKAIHTPTIDQRVASANASDTGDLAERTPTLEASLSGEESELPSPEPITVPEEVSAEDPAAPPEPEIEVPAAPEQPANVQETGVLDAITRLFSSGADPEAIEDRVQSVSTSNPGIETRVEERADIPLEGANDPARMDDAAAARGQEAAGARGEATQAVLDGPGPEAIEPRAIDHAAPEVELTARETSALEPVAGVEQLNSLALPGEVTARFDEQTGTSMAQSAQSAAQQMGEAETERDTAHAEAVDTAEQSRAQAEQDADQAQRDTIVERREAIQAERQSTVDAQQAAVDDVNTQAEQERTASRAEADQRVASDREEIDRTYDEAERESDAEVASGEERAEREQAEAERESENESWWDRATSFIARAFEALTSAIGAIFDAVKAAVSAIIDAAVSAVSALIRLAASALQAIVEAYGELLKGLIDGLLGDIFPELAAALTEFVDAAVAAVNTLIDAAANAMIAAVEAAGAALNSAINALLDLYQSAINAALSVLQAALTGDWGAVLRQVLDGILSLLGIDPAAFHAMIAQATEAIDTIVNDPGAFVGNMLDAVVGGIQQFADNFGDHLRAGIIGWLTGALGDIEMPETWDLWGVLDIARQILGLTWDFVRERAARIIGQENVERLEMAFDWIMTLVNEGWSGVWERIQGELESLKDAVLEGIRNLVMEKVVIAAITWLASLFNPVGAIVKLVMTIWNIYQFVSEQLQRLFGIAQAVVEGIANIARGVLGPAMNKVEEVLANMVPVVISLLMSLLGVTGIAARVQDIIARIREAIANAVDRMIDRVIGMFTGGRRGRGGADDGDEAGGADLEDVDNVRVNVEGGPNHTLSVEPIGEGGATIMMRSEPMSLSDWLGTLSTQADQLEDETVKTNTKQKIQEVRQSLASLDDEADHLAASDGPNASEAQQSENENSVGDIENGMRTQLAGKLGEIFEALGLAGGDAILGRFSAEIERLHDDAKLIVRRELQDNADNLISLEWPAVVTWFEQNVALVQDPLNRSRNFGEKARDEFKSELDRQDVTGDDEQRTLLNKIAAGVRSNEGDYANLKDELRDLIFAKTPLTSATIASAVTKALETNSDAHPDLERAIASKGLIEFLIEIAQGKTYVGQEISINERKFEELWTDPSRNNPNVKLVKDKFRALNPFNDSGPHEWIPTNMVQAVVERASQPTLAGQEASETAALWIRVHTTWRSRTRDLILDPSRPEYVRSIRLSGLTAHILQGHPGAVYARFKDGAASADVSSQQTVGSPPWHEDLRVHFRRAAARSGESTRILGDLINDVETFASRTVWSNPGLTSELRRFEQYFQRIDPATSAYQSTRGGSPLTLQALASRQRAAWDRIAQDFDNARGVLS
jgi:phage-related protein